MSEMLSGNGARRLIGATLLVALFVATVWMRSAEPIKMVKDNDPQNPQEVGVPLEKRGAFLSKVYATVFLQLATTAVVAFLIFSLRPSEDEVFGFEGASFKHQIFPILLSVPVRCLMILLTLGLVVALMYARKDPVRALHLFELLAAVEGYWVGTASGIVGDARVVGYAASLTLLIFFVLSVVGLTLSSAGADFGWYLKPIFAEILALAVWSMIASMTFGVEGPVAVGSAVGALFFSLYILVDTNLIARRYAEDEWVVAALELYLDVINLFLKLLELLAKSKKD